MENFRRIYFDVCSQFLKQFFVQNLPISESLKQKFWPNFGILSASNKKMWLMDIQIFLREVLQKMKQDVANKSGKKTKTK